jgi:K+-sensing histidine kinase KdpD
MASDTFFAPPERDPPELIDLQVRYAKSLDLLDKVLDALPEIAFVLNGKRQVVFANEAASRLLGLACAGVIGKRPGEIVSCVHSGETAAGCGTAEACRYCGAVNAILEAQRTGGLVTRDCRITVGKNQKLGSLDLSITCKSIPSDDNTYLLVTIRDVSDANRRRVLERVFFHDVINSISAMQSTAAMLKEDYQKEGNELVDAILNSAEFLLEEVLKQRDFLAMERGDLAADPKIVDNVKLLREVAVLFSASEIGSGKLLRMDAKETVEAQAYADPVLLRRVLVNMVKNALEASKGGDEVVVWTAPSDGRVRFSVRNPAVMTEEVRLQVFQRSFSTKGPGRGIGTYSMRMLATEYLNGSIEFSSAPGEGTTFWVDIPALSEAF